MAKQIIVSLIYDEKEANMSGNGGEDPELERERDRQLKNEESDRASNLKSIQEERRAIIKSQGAPIWNSVTGARPE